MTDTQYRWVVLAYTLLMQAVNVGVLMYCFALFAIPWLEAFDTPRRDVMLAITLLQIGFGLSGPLAGRAMERFQLRTLVLAGLVLFVVALLLSSRVTALWQIQLIYATLFPVSMVLMGTLAAQTLVTRWFATQRGMAIGISATGTNIGGVVFPLIVAGWLTALGWRETFLWLSVVAAVAVGPLTWLVLRRPPPVGQVIAGRAAAEERAWSMGEIVGSRSFWIPALALVPMNIAFTAVLNNLGVLSQDLGFSTAVAADFIALNAVCMIIGKFTFGALGDLMDHRWLYWLAVSLMASSLVVLQTQPGVELFVVGVVLMGLSGGSMLPMFGIMYGTRFGVAAFSRVMGLGMMVMMASSLGPLLAGWSYDVTGGYTLAFRGFALAMVPAALAMTWLPQPALQIGR